MGQARQPSTPTRSDCFLPVRNWLEVCCTAAPGPPTANAVQALLQWAPPLLLPSALTWLTGTS